MAIDRRTCIKRMAGLGGMSLLAPASRVFGEQEFTGNPERFGVLVDLTVCIGCRKCEHACNEANELSSHGAEFFDDKSVFEEERRTRADQYTVVNRYENPRDAQKPIYVKKQCMHCDEAACASACLVKAFNKTPAGPVVYDASLCMGCRYCMVACPFNIPAYEYDDPWTPEVTKCTMCVDRIGDGEVPACVSKCPVEALTFGRRSELIDVAHDRIWRNSDKYVNHVYGEKEVGGTSWLYLSPVPFEEIGFRTDLGTEPIPEKSRGFLSAVAVVLLTWPVLCMGFFSFSKRREQVAEEEVSS